MEQVILQLTETVKQLTETNNSLTEQLKGKDEQIKQLNDKLQSHTPQECHDHIAESAIITTTTKFDTTPLIQNQIEKYVNENYITIQKGRGDDKEQPMTMKAFVYDIKQQSFYTILSTIEKRKYGVKWIKDIMLKIVRVETPKNRGCEIYIKKKQTHSNEIKKIEQKSKPNVSPMEKKSPLVKEAIKLSYGLGQKQQPKQKQKYELLFNKKSNDGIDMNDIPLTESDEQFIDEQFIADIADRPTPMSNEELQTLIESEQDDDENFDENFDVEFEDE